MPTRRRWAGLVLFGLLTPVLAAQPPLERRPIDPDEFQPTPQQKALLNEIQRLGGRADIIGPFLFEPREENKKPEPSSLASITALDDRLGKQLSALLPLVKQLPDLRSLYVEAIEVTEADLRLLGQLREAKGLRSVTIRFRRLPSNAKWLVQQALPQLPVEPMDWFHDPRWLLERRDEFGGRAFGFPSPEPAIQLVHLPALAELRPRRVDPAAPPRRQLQVERHNIAIEWHQIVWRLFDAGRMETSIESVKPAHEGLLRSALDLCETPQERVRVWELYVETMAAAHQTLDRRAKAGLRNATAEQVAGQMADLLAAKIELLKARQAAENRP